jgi:hypothetical protein
MLQLSCLFKSDSSSPYLISMIGLAVVPIVMAACGYIFWFLLSKVLPKHVGKTYHRNSITTAFVFCYLTYPSITNLAFEGINCKEIQGVKYLVRDFGIECWTQ